ncbi:MAG: flagellar hook protein FlgE [Kiritimatiellia bacterium]|jgi:flagellar hook protein FlgE
MSLFNTLNTGASGLGASGNSMAVIGDNIANINTRGYKRGRIAFADVMPQFIGSVNGTSQLGRGASVSSVSTMHLQGGLQSTGSSLDVAIGGRGFFQVTDGTNKMFTRDGSFRVSKDNYITTLGGLHLQGFPAIEGQISGQAGDLRLDTTPLGSKATSMMTLNAVLAPEKAWDGSTPLATIIGTADGSAIAPSIQELTSGTSADFHTSITVYDSLGQPHEVTTLMEQTGANEWTYYTVVDGSEIDADDDGIPDNPNGGAKRLSSGTITFDTDGNLTDHTVDGTTSEAQWAGAEDWAPTYDFGFDGGSGNLANNGKVSSAISFQQDGYSTAFLTSLNVEGDGTIVGQYDNGESQTLGQIAIASFGADDGLNRMGGNLYTSSLASGDATLGAAGTGGRGNLSGFALEQSNVDLENEFVSMIQSQRSYQANASTVRSSDESLQTLVNLV